MKNPITIIKFFFCLIDLGIDRLDRKFSRFLNWVWKYETFWKWYYRAVPVAFFGIWIWMFFNQDKFGVFVLYK